MPNLRRDAAYNRERLMLAALATIEERGGDVSIDDLARAAGVGVATFYRNFSSRDDLLRALERRSYGVIEEIVTTALQREELAVDVLRAYLEHCVARRSELYAPLRGGAVATDAPATERRARIVRAIDDVIDRGRHDQTIRCDIGAVDIIVFAAMLTRPLPHVADWDTIAHRQIEVMISGLSRIDDKPLGAPAPQYGTIERAYRDSADPPRRQSDAES